MNDERKREGAGSGSAASFSSVLLFWIVVLLVPGIASGATGAEVIEKVQEKLADFKTFSARFEKQFYWAALDKRSTRHGRIYLQRPNRFRVEVEDDNLVIADGQAIWAYSRKNTQVVVSPYQGELKTPWEVLLDYAESYEPVAIEEIELDGRKAYLLVLKPQTTGSTIAQMKVWVDRKRWLLLRVEQLEVDDNVTTYLLADHKIDKKLDDDLFQFSSPDGTTMIDRREPVESDD